MAVQVLITAGQDKGKSFDFDQLEVKLGRTTDNDLVLTDAGVSRKHARLFQRGGRWHVEDSGSANGTQLNGKRLAGPAPLSTGDKVEVGPVVLAITVLEAPEEEEEEEAATPGAGQSTRIVDTSKPLEQSTRIVSVDQVSKDDPAARTKTGQMGAVPRSRTGVNPAVPGATRAPLGTGPVATSRPGLGASPVVSSRPNLAAAPVAPSRPGISRPAGGRPAPDEPAPAGSALERVRARRELGDSLGGQVSLGFSQMSPVAKAGMVLGVLALLAAGAAVLLKLSGAVLVSSRPPEPTALGRERVEASFGLGEVDYERRDEKTFEFEFATAGRAVALLHYRSRSISQGEVSIVLNGAQQGLVPPDVSDPERESEQVFAVKDLRRGQKNVVTFDNLRNPPGKEEWVISRLQLEIIPIPDAPEEQLAALANEYAAKGQRYYDLREVGPENLFRAWKQYRSAWLYMEAMGTRPELHGLVLERYLQISRELDNLCQRLILDVKKSVELKNIPRADKAAERVLSFFPTNEHRCHGDSRRWRSELDYTPPPEEE
ncbi:MAG: hypothetical protein RL653_1981 [Pseudomonadota bacterium]